MDSDERSELIGGTLSGLLGLAAMAATGWFSYGLLEAFLEELCCGSGMPETSDAGSELVDSMVEAADGNTSAVTSVLGILSSVAGSAGGGDVIVVETHDKKAYDRVEEKARKLYDKYNNNHKVEENKTLIINDDEVGHLVEEVFKGKSKKEIIMAINSLEEILQEVNNKEEKPKTKTKKL